MPAYTITDSWKEIGRGPVTINLEKGEAWVYSGLVSPLSNNQFTVISSQRPQHKYSGLYKTFARISKNSEGIKTLIEVKKNK